MYAKKFFEDFSKSTAFSARPQLKISFIIARVFEMYVGGTSAQLHTNLFSVIFTKLTGLVDIGLIRMYTKFEREKIMSRSHISFISRGKKFLNENY